MNGLLSVRLGAVHGSEAVPDSRSCQTLGVPRQSRGITFLFIGARSAPYRCVYPKMVRRTVVFVGVALRGRPPPGHPHRGAPTAAPGLACYERVAYSGGCTPGSYPLPLRGNGIREFFTFQIASKGVKRL